METLLVFEKKKKLQSKGVHYVSFFLSPHPSFFIHLFFFGRFVPSAFCVSSFDCLDITFSHLIAGIWSGRKHWSMSISRTAYQTVEFNCTTGYFSVLCWIDTLLWSVQGLFFHFFIYFWRWNVVFLGLWHMWSLHKWTILIFGKKKKKHLSNAAPWLGGGFDVYVFRTEDFKGPTWWQNLKPIIPELIDQSLNVN